MGAELWNSTAHINPYLDFPSPVTWTKGCSNASLSCWRNGSTDRIKTRYYILHTTDTHSTDADTYYRYSPSRLPSIRTLRSMVALMVSETRL